MSKEAVIQLLTRAESDAGLKQELETALESGEDRESAFLQAAAKHGCDFTADEMQGVVTEADATPESAELSDEDLEKVAGGVGTFSAVRLTSPQIRLGHRFASRLGGGRSPYPHSGAMPPPP